MPVVGQYIGGRPLPAGAAPRAQWPQPAVWVPGWKALAQVGVEVRPDGQRRPDLRLLAGPSPDLRILGGPWDSAPWGLGTVAPFGPSGPRVLGITVRGSEWVLHLLRRDGDALAVAAQVPLRHPPVAVLGLRNALGSAAVVTLWRLDRGTPAGLPPQYVAAVRSWRGGDALGPEIDVPLPRGLVPTDVYPVVLDPGQGVSGGPFRAGGELELLTLGPYGRLQWSSVEAPGGPLGAWPVQVARDDRGTVVLLGDGSVRTARPATAP